MTRFLTVAEVAAMLRVSPMTIYRLVRRGELDAIRVARTYRIPGEAVARYMQLDATGLENCGEQ